MFPQQISSITVLHVDDDEPFLDLSKSTLEHSHADLTVHSVLDAETALDRLETGDIDCVITDYQMTGMDGLAFLTRIREIDPDLPVVFFTGRGSEEIASEAISAGVTDYIQKGTDKAFLLLGNRLLTLVAKHRSEVSAREAAERIRQIYDRISEAFLAVDADWQVAYLNPYAEDLFECVAADVVGTPMWEAFPALTEGRFGETFRASAEEQESLALEAYYEPLDRWLSFVVYPDETGLSMFVRDVTEYRRAEQQVEQMRERVATAESQFRTFREKVSRPAAPFR